MYSEDEYLLLSGVQHFAFCRRQWALIHIEQQWEENYRTVDGEIIHEKVRTQRAYFSYFCQSVILYHFYINSNRFYIDFLYIIHYNKGK